METQNKLKPGPSPFAVTTALVIVILILAAILKSNFGEEFKNTTFGIFWAAVTVVQLIFWFKTRNPGYFTFSIVGVFMSASLISGYKGIYFLIPFLIVLGIHFYFISGKQMKWRYRDVLEKAALPVDETKDGFTPRPMPAGKVNFSKETFNNLGKFLSRNLIAFPMEYKDNSFLLIRNMKGIWFQNPDMHRDSYISFDKEGNISVNISKPDYQKFKEELTFDQLCVSLAGMFIEFWELFENGKQKEIISRLDSKKTSAMEGAV